MSNQTKHTSSASNQTKHSETWIDSQGIEISDSALLKEDGTNLLLETGDQILLEKSVKTSSNFTNQIKH